MFESMLMQNALSDVVMATLVSILSAAAVIIPIARYWVNKAKDSTLTGEKADAFLAKVLGVLDQGQKVVEATQNQEVKIKQLSEVVFNSLPDKGESIREKYEIKLVNLQRDIDNAVKGTQIYDAKVKEIEALLAEIQAGYKQ